MRESRRTAGLRAALVLALALVFAACGGDDGGGSGGGGGGEAADTLPNLDEATGAPERAEITVGGIPITDLTQLYVADAQGFFEEEGLQVEIQNFAGGAEIAPAVRGGSVDLGWSNSVSIIQAGAQGLNFRFFAGGLFQGPGHWTQAIVAPEDSEIQGPEDLRNRSLAVNTLGNINTLVARAYLDQAGVDPQSVDLVEVPFPDMPAAIDGGRVDAALPTEPFVTISQRTANARVIDEDPFSALGEEPLVAGWFSTEDWIRENPNTAAAFKRAIEQATQYIDDNPDVRQEVLPQYTAVEEALAGEIGFGLHRPDITVEDIQPQIDMSAEYGLIPESYDASRIVVDSSGAEGS